MKRYGLVAGARDEAMVERYLPNNYEVIAEIPADPNAVGGLEAHTQWVIAGEDDHGWTLDGYVIPRLQSGLIGCQEIDLSHPVMKQVPIRAQGFKRLVVTFDITDMSPTAVEALSGEVLAQAEASEAHDDVRVGSRLERGETCLDCGREDEVDRFGGLCDSCETQRRFDEVSNA